MDNFTIVKTCKPSYSKDTMFRVKCWTCECEFVVKGNCPKSRRQGARPKIECPNCGNDIIFSANEFDVFNESNLTKEEQLTVEIHELKDSIKSNSMKFDSERNRLHAVIRLMGIALLTSLAFNLL